MKIVCIGDTHAQHNMLQMPEADMVLYAGDIMTDGFKEEELTSFLEWFHDLPYKWRIFIAGNHCRWIESFPARFRERLKKYPGLIYLENEAVTIKGIKIWGSPVTPFFFNWAFNARSEVIHRYWDQIPKDTNILLTHGPAYGILDYSVRGVRCGCRDLAQRIAQLPYLKYHVFGHIHEGYGVEQMENYTAVNCSAMNEHYQLVNEPVAIEY